LITAKRGINFIDKETFTLILNVANSIGTVFALFIIEFTGRKKLLIVGNIIVILSSTVYVIFYSF